MISQRICFLARLLVASLVGVGCDNSIEPQEPENDPNDPYAILVDASHDDGGWWFPQSDNGGFSASAPHQGKALADFIRSRGFRVDELPRGVTVTEALLNRYDKVIRADNFGLYTESELQAYEAFLQRRTSLVLISEYLRVQQKDALAVRLGLPFVGLADGSVTKFANHPITQGMGSLSYIAGSVILDPSVNPAIEVLGWLSDDTYIDLNDNSIRDVNEPTGAAAMGILHHPNVDKPQPKNKSARKGAKTQSFRKE